MVLGALIALFKDDLKALLAFSTVSHLGLLTCFWASAPGGGHCRGVFPTFLNHLTSRPRCCILTAGIVDHEYPHRDIKRLGGLRHLMPITFVIGTVAALSMAGLPLLNGFLPRR